MATTWLEPVLAVLARDARAESQPPRDLFHCYLDEQPGYLVPPRLLPAPPERSRPASLSEDCWLSSSGTPPDELRGRLAFPPEFAPAPHIAVVADRVTGSLRPFWLGPRLAGALAGARPGTPIDGLSGRETAILTLAGVLHDEDLAARREQTWVRAVARARRQFEDGYAPVAGLLHPFHIGALRRYYRARIRLGHFPLGDGQSSRRYVAYDEGATRWFHNQLAPGVAALVGRPVKPSYVYVASYQGGAELPRHVDREQCEYSLTMCLDFVPEPIAETPWPIRLEAGERTVDVFQAIGDGLLYRGRRLPHSRARLGQGQTSTSIFFHYVDEDFEGPLS